mmetsp:Transcript_58070/g.160579  ORF Transcript_58070/g.160579 Transcript_58070/m.160579 type:complete len:304 (-) Transcript_58070:866-1777(-)
MAPPVRGPTFLRSAIFDLISGPYSASQSGIRQMVSPVASELASRALARSSSGDHIPAYLSPRATMHAPVSVAMSTIASTSSFSANTRASARVRRPSASVLITSIVFPLDAVRISPGRIALSEIMFSHAATMKCTSTSLGLSRPMAFAVPKVAPEPPMSNFISSIKEAPTFRLYPPESKVRPLPTIATFLVGVCGGLYVRWMNLGPCSSSEPLATPMYAPMPRASTASRSRISASSPCSMATSTAISASDLGVTTFGGEATRSRQTFTPAIILRARSAPSVLTEVPTSVSEVSLTSFSILSPVR